MDSPHNLGLSGQGGNGLAPRALPGYTGALLATRTGPAGISRSQRTPGMERLFVKPISQTDALLEYLQGRHPRIRFIKLRHRIEEDDTEEHMHSNLYQLTYCSEGRGIVRLPPWEFETDATRFYIFNPTQLHALVPFKGESFENVTCRFELPDFPAPLLAPEIQLEPAEALEGYSLLCRIQADVMRGAPSDLVYAGLRLTKLLLLLAKRCGSDQQEALSPLIRKAIQEMGERFQTLDGIHAVAMACGVTTSHLSRAFRKETGITTLEYLHRVRLGFALERLFRTESSLSDIAQASGFGSLKNLNMAFHRVYAMSPSDFRAKHRENNPLPQVDTTPRNLACAFGAESPD